jgi:hypothetical protein
MLRTSDSERPAETFISEQSDSLLLTSNRLGTWVLFSLVTIALAVAVGMALGDIFTLADTEWYLRIARGDMRDVIQPFASRQLGPLIVKVIAERTRISIESGFFIEAALSIVVTVATVGYLLIRSGVRWGILLAVSLIAFWANLFNGLVLPDLFYAALTGIFLVLLWKQRYLAACLMLLPMEVCREATILVLLCLLVAGWRRIRLVHAGAALAATYAGMRIVKILARPAGTNQEHVNALLYMVGKLPWNFSKNVLGFPLWNNLNKPCEVPSWQTAIHVGGVRAIGVCSFSPVMPVWSVCMALATFGLFPLLLIYIWRQHGLAVNNRDTLVRFCVVYGGISFLLAPMLGASVPRLFSYAWPLFLVAVPILAQQYLKMKPNVFSALLAIHLVLSWLTVINHSRRLALGMEALLLFVCVLGYLVSWVLISRASRPSTVRPLDSGDHVRLASS